MAAYRKIVRDRLALNGNSLETLHASSLATLHRLRDRGVGLVILDECHHLMGHWGRVLADAPGTSGTANRHRLDGHAARSRREAARGCETLRRVLRAHRLRSTRAGRGERRLPGALPRPGVFRPTNIRRVAVPGNRRQRVPRGRALALRRSSARRATGASTSRNTSCSEPLPVWLERILQTLQLPTGQMKDWTTFERRDPELARIGPLFLTARGVPLPPGVPPPDEAVIDPQVQELDLARSGPGSATSAIGYSDRTIRPDHALAEQAIAKLRLLGVSDHRDRIASLRVAGGPRHGLFDGEDASTLAYPRGRDGGLGRDDPCGGHCGLREDVGRRSGSRAFA